MPEKTETHFASSERANEADLLLQIRLVTEVPIIKDLFDSMPVFMAILNQERQIIYSNKLFTDFFKSHNLLTYVGKRPGEAINCLHAGESGGGCGTSEACSVCGAVNAILMSQKNGSSQMECRITLENRDSLDLLITANQYKINDNFFTIFTATDISHQKRRQALERLFFHDLLNTTGALTGFLNMIKDAPETEREEYINFSKTITEHLVDEIVSQKRLTLAEDNELQINVTPFSTLDILNEVMILFGKQIVSVGKSIVIEKGAVDVIIRNDKTILRRIIGNLVKNALETAQEGETVILNCRQEGEFVLFSINNKAVMPRDIQLQVFQRSFSTKGQGRGLGTYSVRLLTERYLKGKAYFTSEKESGTTFYLKYPLDIEK